MTILHSKMEQHIVLYNTYNMLLIFVMHQQSKLLYQSFYFWLSFGSKLLFLFLDNNRRHLDGLFGLQWSVCYLQHVSFLLIFSETHRIAFKLDVLISYHLGYISIFPFFESFLPKGER
jgi:hypothetical protein